MTRYALRPGTKLEGPAVFEERESSFIVGPDCTVTVDRDFNLIAEFQADAAAGRNSPGAEPAHTGSGP